MGATGQHRRRRFRRRSCTGSFFYAFEIWDTIRPVPRLKVGVIGSPQSSLLSPLIAPDPRSDSLRALRRPAPSGGRIVALLSRQAHYSGDTKVSAAPLIRKSGIASSRTGAWKDVSQSFQQQAGLEDIHCRSFRFLTLPTGRRQALFQRRSPGIARISSRGRANTFRHASANSWSTIGADAWLNQQKGLKTWRQVRIAGTEETSTACRAGRSPSAFRKRVKGH